jgi:hypothetical protein
MDQASTYSSAEGGSQGPPASTGNTLVANVYMLKGDAHIEIRTRYYEMSKSNEKGKEATNPLVPLHIEKTMGETMTRIPKGALKKDSHNPNMRAAQNYFVVEYLAQTPCTMSTLEVLQSFPS